MDRAEAVMNYKTAVSVFKKWLGLGYITEGDFQQIDAITANKYGLSLSSIYRTNDLICQKNRANIGMFTDEGDAYE